MKIRIIFTEPPYANLQSTKPKDADEKLIFIQDPYNITIVDDGRHIVSVDQSKITYEDYCVQLQRLIADTIRAAQLDKEICESITIEGCKEPPNFEALQHCLANTHFQFQSPCQLTIKDCSFGGDLYMNATRKLIQSAKKHGQDDVFFNLTLEETSGESKLSEHDKLKLGVIKNITFDIRSPVKQKKIEPLSANRQVIQSVQPGSKDDAARPQKAPRPSYFFKGNIDQRGSSKSALMHFFSQANQQRNDYTCGPAALKMLADFYTAMQRRPFCDENSDVVTQAAWSSLNTTPEMEIAAQVKTTEEVGSEIANMRNGLRALGISVIDDCDGMIATGEETEKDSPTLIEYKKRLWEKLCAILELGIPVIINMRNYEDIGHYEVAIGIDEKNNIIFAEPGQALDGKLEFEVLPKDTFIKRWKNMSGEHHGRFLIPLPNEASLQQIESILQDIPHYCNGEKKDPSQSKLAL